MNLEECTQAIRTKVGADSGLAATLKFDCGADGVIVIDGKSTPNTVSNENRDADCTISITHENLEALLGGQLDDAGRAQAAVEVVVEQRLGGPLDEFGQ